MTDTSHDQKTASNQNANVSDATAQKPQDDHKPSLATTENNAKKAQEASPADQEQAQDQTQAKDGHNIEDVLKVIENLQTENAELKDRSLRLIADMENLRRRTEREISEKQKYAVTNFAREIVGLADNLQRALGVIPGEALKQHPTLNAFYEGVEMTERELMNILERQKISKIDAIGKPFDPNCHQAMFETPTDDVPPGTVMQVMQEGFMIDERVLRPAMVGVSKALPKAEPVEASKNDGISETAKTQKAAQHGHEEPLDLTKVVEENSQSNPQKSEDNTNAESDETSAKTLNPGQRLDRSA